MVYFHSNDELFADSIRETDIFLSMMIRTMKPCREKALVKKTLNETVLFAFFFCSHVSIDAFARIISIIPLFYAPIAKGTRVRKQKGT
jgi:hypothetical protein